MTVEDDRDNSPLEEQVFWCNSSSTTLYRFFLISSFATTQTMRNAPMYLPSVNIFVKMREFNKNTMELTDKSHPNYMEGASRG
jgi:hypothetical protein